MDLYLTDDEALASYDRMTLVVWNSVISVLVLRLALICVSR